MNEYERARSADFVIRDALDSTRQIIYMKLGKGSEVYARLHPDTQKEFDGLFSPEVTSGKSLPYFLAERRMADIEQAIFARNETSDFTERFPGFERDAVAVVGKTAKEAFAEVRQKADDWGGRTTPQTVGQFLDGLGIIGDSARMKVYNQLAAVPGIISEASLAEDDKKAGRRDDIMAREINPAFVEAVASLGTLSLPQEEAVNHLLKIMPSASPAATAPFQIALERRGTTALPQGDLRKNLQQGMQTALYLAQNNSMSFANYQTGGLSNFLSLSNNIGLLSSNGMLNAEAVTKDIWLIFYGWA